MADELLATSEEEEEEGLFCSPITSPADEDNEESACGISFTPV